ncbi:single-stranded-DNA-specific exonuclease RecJ [Tissierella sp. Yu-01]|uniref:single-stranded-DNA-specific exonuclease RecJ n=1 Tax=Tissierella sp. Yu-01 TaxID=3035694 RepID=UPI00240DF7CE|nr:single-stranded-DNA-specific exonuclease RecJ [Tissierella sp. Yu-01]WFA09847.1 single-stranded-DNA-specific exonuclease RecJ [Tissierella sp. Yu-01]
MEKWFIRNKNYDYRKISKQFGVSEILAKLLVNRDIIDDSKIDLFLNPQMKRLNNPECMKDLVKGANIIIDKIKQQNRIRIVGDYDVDGVMSVYILYKGLKTLGADVDYVIPDRVLDGYGINIEIIDMAYSDGIDTIITCDNGISAIEQINHAKELGLTVIVTDHHDIPYKEENEGKTYLSSNADAIINPKQMECDFPEKNLCGASIAYRLIMYLYDILNKSSVKDDFLEFIAIATICDVVDLIGENRIIVKNGLKALNNTNNIGLKALFDLCDIKDRDIGVYHVGFIIGPTINASGRLDSALHALELLLTDDIQEAYEKAKELRDLNDERKDMTLMGVERIVKQIETSSIINDNVIVVYDPEIHESIAGIIAGRIKEKYNKPTIVLTNGNEGVKGSARSIEGYNMYEELSKCKGILKKFGGHPMAAGLSLDSGDINNLRNAINDCCSLTDEDLIPKIYIDMELPIEYINFKIIEEIKILEPFGMGNSKPLFGAKGLKIQKAMLLGSKKNVLKLILISPHKGQRIEGLLFNDAESFIDNLTDKYGKHQFEKILNGIENNINVDILYYPDINEYMGNVTIQVIISSYRFR